MTTPSRNEHSVEKLRSAWYYGDSQTPSYRNFVGKWHDDVRPASGNAGRKGQFKLCRGFTHDFRDWLNESGTCSVGARQSNGTIQWTRATNGGLWGGLSPPLGPTLPSSNMVNAAIVKALNKLKGQDIHLGNFLAEADKSIHMIAGRIRNVKDTVLAFRRRYPGLWPVVRAVQTGNLPRHLWCKIPQQWLEVQYGWRPLLADILGGLRHIEKLSKSYPPYAIAHGVQSDAVETTLRSQALTGMVWGDAKFLTERTARVFLVYELTNFALAELSSLGLINPLEIVWEQTRWSFVVDWVLPIGPWLSALTADAGMSFLTGGQTLFGRQTYSSGSVIVDNRYVYSGGPPKLSGRAVTMNRTCYSSTPFPGLYVKNPISGEHVANATALLAQAFYQRSLKP